MLTEATNDLLADLEGQDGQPLLVAAKLRRLLQRAIYPLCADLRAPFRLLEESITPPMPPEIREAWLLRAKIMAYETLVARTADSPSWSAGDTSMSNQFQTPQRYNDLLTNSKAQYREMISRISPDSDPDVVSMDSVVGGGRRGIFHQHHCHHGSGECR